MIVEDIFHVMDSILPSIEGDVLAWGGDLENDAKGNQEGWCIGILIVHR